MNYPLISEYVEAIKSAEDNFDELSYLRPVLGEDGLPIMTGGNFAVVFKMEDKQSGKLYAVKCFTREQEGRNEAYKQIAEELEYVNSTFLTPIKYLDKELFVDTNQTDETVFPILLMDWVEGVTFDKYIRMHLDNQYELSLLAYQFSRLAMWLMPQPFDHGDLKPDNILVKSDGTLVLVDYDGMYVPAMKGQRARELGSPDFHHPGRTETDFDEHIDDFSLASILLSLKAISLQPSLLEEYGASDRLLFSEKDYRNLSESKVMDALKSLLQDAELASLYSLFILALSQNNLSQVSFRLFNLARPNRPQHEENILSTEVTEEDLANVWTDEYGVMYSEDRKQLIKAPYEIAVYSIYKGTKFICHDAFLNCSNLKSITIPDSVITIGTNAFFGCSSLSSITIPTNVIEIGDSAFSYCDGLTNVVILNGLQNIGFDAFKWCNGLKSIMIPGSVIIIGEGAFCNCNGLTSISILNGVEIIGDSAFWGCDSLTSIYLPASIMNIGDEAFHNCDSLLQIIIPEGTKRKFEELLPNYIEKLVEEDNTSTLPIN